MKEKRFECLMMLQIHRSDTLALMQLLTDLPPLQHGAFLPRDAMRKRRLCCRPVSVCPSVTLMDCIQTAEDIVKLYVGPSSPIIPVFDPQCRYLFRGETLHRGPKYTRGGKNLRFSMEIAVYFGN